MLVAFTMSERASIATAVLMLSQRPACTVCCADTRRALSSNSAACECGCVFCVCVCDHAIYVCMPTNPVFLLSLLLTSYLDTVFVMCRPPHVEQSRHLTNACMLTLCVAISATLTSHLDTVFVLSPTPRRAASTFWKKFLSCVSRARISPLQVV